MGEMLQILQHSLGVDEFGRGEQYRNRFIAGGKNLETCREAERLGLMEEVDAGRLTGGNPCFCVTPSGIDYVAINSPKPPETPKLTRGQKRYREYVGSEYGGSFAEYLGIRR